ncbi:Trimethylguanosine synthase, partial [Trichinella patagoniensis]
LFAQNDLSRHIFYLVSRILVPVRILPFPLICILISYSQKMQRPCSVDFTVLGHLKLESSTNGNRRQMEMQLTRVDLPCNRPISRCFVPEYHKTVSGKHIYELATNFERIVRCNDDRHVFYHSNNSKCCNYDSVSNFAGEEDEDRNTSETDSSVDSQACDLDELELMKAMGLPVQFTSKKKSNKSRKNRHKYRKSTSRVVKRNATSCDITNGENEKETLTLQGSGNMHFCTENFIPTEDTSYSALSEVHSSSGSAQEDTCETQLTDEEEVAKRFISDKEESDYYDAARNSDSESTKSSVIENVKKNILLLAENRYIFGEMSEDFEMVELIIKPKKFNADSLYERKEGKVDELNGTVKSVESLGERVECYNPEVDFNLTKEYWERNCKCILKYWNQRFRLFYKYEEGILLDEQSWFSVTPEAIACHIAKRCKNKLIVDAFCGVGGNAIQFAKQGNFVIAIDIDPVKIKCARNNAKIYQVENQIQFICANFFDIYRKLRSDIVFLAPPWGGPDYQCFREFDVKTIDILDGKSIIEAARTISKSMIYFLPRNSSLLSIYDTVKFSKAVEIEQNYNRTVIIKNCPLTFYIFTVLRCHTLDALCHLFAASSALFNI